MIGQSFYIIIRRFFKDPVFSFVTLMSLTVGFTAFVLLSQFMNGIFSWDIHNVNYDRIYRVQLFQDQKENAVKHSSSVTAALSRHDLLNLPEVENVVLMHDVGDNNKNGTFLSVDKKNQFLTRYGFYADQSVFEIFTFRFLEGDPQNALTRPFSIVLSKTLADKLFPGNNALGRQVYGENKVTLTVTGVFEDLPHRSHWRPTYLLPMLSFTAITGWKNYEDNYMAYSFYIYILLKENADPAQVNAKIHDALKEYRKEHYPYLRPMSKLYIEPYFQPDFYYALAIMAFNALLVLILSSINYINLQTANASTRFREIGIKKAVGFTKKQLWNQFIFESVALSLIGGMLGLLLAHFTTPFFNRLIGGDKLTVLFTDWKLLMLVLFAALLTGLLSGIHPAFAISSYNPVAALKQRFIQDHTNGISLKKILVTAQFSISIFLLTVGLIMYRQTHYMVSKDMGFESHNLLFANIITDKTGPLTGLTQQLLNHPEIEGVCHSDYIPYILPGGNEISWEGAYPDQKVFVRYSRISYDFVPTFDMKMAKGRNFSREFPADYDKCLVNETAVRLFGWKDPIGKQMEVNNKKYEVIGVIKDYVVFSVHNPTEPHLYRLIPDSIVSDRVYSVRYAPGQEARAKEIVQREFEAFFPDDAFEFIPIQNRIQNENAVKEWRSLMKVNIAFALMSVIISSIGLFGLILLYVRHKLKEVGIRKVLGFSFGQLYFTLSSGFIKLLFISIVFAWPAAYYTYKILPGSDKYPIQIWEFIIATLIILFVAVATISYQIIKAVRTSAVEVLKDE